MEFNQIDKSADYISECGNFKIFAVDMFKNMYYPMMRQGDMQDFPVIFKSVSTEPVSFNEAKEIISNY